MQNASITQKYDVERVAKPQLYKKGNFDFEPAALPSARLLPVFRIYKQSGKSGRDIAHFVRNETQK
jgi:hypothetical protein